MLRGEQYDPKKVCSVAQFGCQIPHTTSLLRKATIQNQAACVHVRNYSFHCLLTCCFAARPSPQGFCMTYICVLAVYVILIKMTCAVNWMIMRERRAESTSLSCPDLAQSRGKTVSGHLELSPDAVDDHDFCCALSYPPCSTTCYCIAVWAVES